MATTAFQTGILKCLASSRKASGESYLAGGVALNAALSESRRSRDIDVFHDSAEALQACWQNDRQQLEGNGYALSVRIEREGFIEALVSKQGDKTEIQWARDSAFRFFPLVEDTAVGLVLHPFDLATNKLLALVGRNEVRDWVDMVQCDAKLQPLGFLAWAACGKDPGFNPQSLLELAARVHHCQAEINMLEFEGKVPDAAYLGARWHDAIRNANEIVALLPRGEVGKCILDAHGNLFKGLRYEANTALQNGTLVFHEGTIKGTWPTLRT